VSALAAVPPTVYFNVPAGYALLAPRLESDDDFAARFFSRLRFMFYAAAALPDALAHRLRAVAERVADHDVPLTSSWGATETAPCVTSAHFGDAIVGCMGVPLPGVTVKLAPTGDKLELRVSGPNVTPGYFRNDEATLAAFDDEGFYCTGDAGRLVDEHDGARGLMFNGRIAEDFKLMSGTWVTAGPLRTKLLSACGGVLQDAVITGHNQPFVGALAWVNAGEAERLCGSDDARLREHLAAGLRACNAGAGSAASVTRLLLLDTPPDLDAGEITDKGYINQRRVLECRAEAVALVHADPPDGSLITP
jgi:feruloyl-CoA synthase